MYCYYLKQFNKHVRSKPLVLKKFSHFSEKKNDALMHKGLIFDPYPSKLIYLNFKPLEVVSRYHDPQIQVVVAATNNFKWLKLLTSGMYN